MVEAEKEDQDKYNKNLIKKRKMPTVKNPHSVHQTSYLVICIH
jgi:hypothetical protein